jgi:UPF0755 protein
LTPSKYYQLAAIITLALLAVGVILVFIPYGPAGAGGRAVEFEIEPGQSLGATARLLAERGLIFSRYVFVAYAIFSGHEIDFKAGKYLISSPISIKKLVNIFSEGKAEPEDISVTIPEGTNIADVALILERAGLINAQDFLKPEILEKEGYLFPDTYRFKSPKFQTPNSKRAPKENARSTPYKVANLSKEQVNPVNQDLKQQLVEEIIERMQKNFEAKTEDLFKNLNVQKIKEVIIVASMLEKEVKAERDMRLVAGIIEKRLSKNMPLEIDAAVAYGACYPKFIASQYCDVSQVNIFENLKIDSPYNTYKRIGFPPTPISNPGIVAIRAALNPEMSDYLYYLSAPDGTTIFSKTAAEHAKAVSKYLR